MGKRIFSGAILVLVTIAVVVFNRSFPLLLPIVIALISAASVYELAGAAGVSKNLWLTGPSLILAVAVPFLISTPWIGLALFLYTVVLFLVQLRVHADYTFREIGVLYSMTLLIPLALSLTVPLRDEHEKYGIVLVVFCIAVAWVSDAGAFFAGKFLGKHKLCPNISPKKTVEGLLGGFVLNFLFMMLAGVVLEAVYGAEISVSYLSLVLLSIGGSAISVLGDLSFSLIKRGCHIKDFGNVIPGHGGFLDRFDSVIFTTPFVYYLTSFLPAILA